MPYISNGYLSTTLQQFGRENRKVSYFGGFTHRIEFESVSQAWEAYDAIVNGHGDEFTMRIISRFLHIKNPSDAVLFIARSYEGVLPTFVMDNSEWTDADRERIAEIKTENRKEGARKAHETRANEGWVHPATRAKNLAKVLINDASFADDDERIENIACQVFSLKWAEKAVRWARKEQTKTAPVGNWRSEAAKKAWATKRAKMAAAVAVEPVESVEPVAATSPPAPAANWRSEAAKKAWATKRAKKEEAAHAAAVAAPVVTSPPASSQPEVVVWSWLDLYEEAA